MSDASSKNDKILLKVGLSIFVVYVLFVFVFYHKAGGGYWLEFLIELITSDGKLKDSSRSFVAYKWVRAFELVFHVFVIFAISGFVGLSFARIYTRNSKKSSSCNRVLEKYNKKLTEKLYSESSFWKKVFFDVSIGSASNETIKKIDNNWSDIYKYIEGLNNQSIISLIKKNKIDESLIVNDVESYNCGAAIGRLKGISDALRQIIDLLEYYSKSTSDKRNNVIRDCYYYRSLARGSMFSIPYIRSKLMLPYFLFPVIISIVLSFMVALIISRGDGDIVISLDMTLIIVGLSLIAISFPISNMLFSFIGLLVGHIWRKRSTKYDDLVFYIFSIILYALFSIYLIALGINIMVSTESLVADLIRSTFGFDGALNLGKVIIDSFFHLLLPVSQYSDSSVFLLLSNEAIFFSRMILISTISYLLLLITRFLIYQYNHNYYYRAGRSITVPPELLRTFGIFFVFIFSSFLSYLGILDYLGVIQESGNSLESTQTSSKAAKHLSLESFLPYSVFIGLVGFGLSLSTKELLENYFSGVALKVDSPFEEKDRVVVNSSGMLEVRDIGIRSTEFYDIRKNAIRNIPHRELIKKDIINYTRPTLNYRKEVVKYISKGDSLLDIEGLLLLSTFLANGVKIPKVEAKYEYIFESEGVFKEFLSKDRDDSGMREAILLDLLMPKMENILTEDENLSKVSGYIFDIGDNYINIKYMREELISIIGFGKYDGLDVYHFLDFPVEKNDKIGECLRIIKEASIKINHIYFRLAKVLWNIKISNKSSTYQRKIDEISLNLLDAPRVHSREILQEGKAIREVALNVTLELSEQSDEIIHHINLYTEALSSHEYKSFISTQKDS